MKKQVPAYILKKYLKGQCTPEEEVLVEEWYNSFEDETDYVSAISAVRKRRLKSSIRTRIEHSIGEHRVKHLRLNYLVYTISGVAAMLLIAFLIFHKQVKPTRNDEQLVTITNTTKNISMQLLSDGSHVWMMPGAQLKYNRTFAGNTRQVSLSGESFFEVTKNPAKPFIITSGNLITKVWGTSFRVRDAKDLSYADVTVVTGKVSVKLIHPELLHKTSATTTNVTDEVMIYPNQQVTYSKKEQAFNEKPKADMTALNIWKKPSLGFDSRPLKEVIPILNKAFNVNISTADEKVDGYLLNADFNGLNFPEIMEILHRALDVTYEIHGQNVLLKEDDNQ